MAFVELVARGAAALSLVAVLAFNAHRLASILLDRCPFLLRLCAIVALGLCVAEAAFHVLVALGAFTLAAACAGAAVLTIVVHRLAPASFFRTALSRDLRMVRRVSLLWGRSPHRGRIYCFGALALVVVARALVLVPLGHDSLVYHVTKAALWVQQSDLGAMWGPGQWGTYGLYPGGGEVFLAWAMLPFRNDVVAPLVDAVEWIALGVAMLAFGRELRLREPYASLASGFVLAIPTLRMLVGSGYVELATALSFVLALTFASRFLNSPRGIYLVFSLAMLGLFASTKFTAMPTAAVLGAVILIAAIYHRKRIRFFVPCVLAAVLVSSVLVLPWMVLSVQRTGVPFSPLPVELFGMKLGLGDPFMKHASYPEPYVWKREWQHLASIFPLPGVPNEALGALCLLPLLTFPVGWLTVWRRNRAVAVIALLSVGAVVAAYYGRSFAQVRLTWPVSSSRFLLPAFLVAVPVSLAWCRYQKASGKLWFRVLWGATLFNLVFLSTRFLTTYEVLGMLLILLGVVLSAAVATSLLARHRPRSAIIWSTSAALVLLALLSQAKQTVRYDLVRDGTVIHPTAKYWVSAARAIDEATPHAVAITSGPQLPCIWFSYYFLGRSLQNTLRYVSPLPDGEYPAFCPGDDWAPQADFDVWYSRLRREEIQEVMSFRPPSVELRWMEQHPELFRLVSGSRGDWGLFRLREQPRGTAVSTN